MDILDADNVPCYVGDLVFDDDGNEFYIYEILLRDGKIPSVRSKDHSYICDVSRVHHDSQGMRIFFISKDLYFSLSKEDQINFTNDVQEAYNKVVDSYFGSEDNDEEESEESIDSRNQEIFNDFAQGVSRKDLMEKYGLSYASIYNITTYGSNVVKQKE